MEGLHQLEIVILLLGVVLALTTIAQKIVVPYPILLVIGGLILSLIPGVPTVTLNPDLVFLVFFRRFYGRPHISRPGGSFVATSGRFRCSQSGWWS
jgi:hypothetical protein